MIVDILDNKRFRVIFALFIGVPLTFLYLIALPSGLMMGIVGLRELEAPTLAMGIAAILGSFGIIGAWLRLIKRWDEFSTKQLILIRALLICGVAATLIILILTIWAETFLRFGLPSLVLLVGGILFYLGT